MSESFDAPRGLHPSFDDVVANGARLQRLWSGGAWTEGPVYLPREDAVVFSDIPNDRTMRWSVAGTVETSRPSGRANGHARIPGTDRVLRCEQSGRRIVEVVDDRTVRSVVEGYRGGRFHSPNDIVVKSDGTVWFSDPPYGLTMNWPEHDGVAEIEGTHVFRFDPATGELDAVTDVPEDPNGLAFSPDESVLYVSDTSRSRHAEGNHHILAFDVVAGRRLARPRVFVTIDPGLSDGFCVDHRGNVLTSAGESVWVVAPDGVRLGEIPVPEHVSNCTFGGPDGRRLFITATTSLYAIDVQTGLGEHTA